MKLKIKAVRYYNLRLPVTVLQHSYGLEPVKVVCHKIAVKIRMLTLFPGYNVLHNNLTIGNVIWILALYLRGAR